MSFYLLMKQRGTGCDYMIGCGMKYVRLEADSMNEARLEAAEEHHTSDNADYFEEALILQVGEVVDFLEGDKGNQDVSAKEYRKVQKKLNKLKAENEKLQKDATSKSTEYRVLAEALGMIFGDDFIDRVRMGTQVKDCFMTDGIRRMGEITSGDIFTKALDERASQLVAPKMKAKKKMASDFLERLKGASSPQESEEIMQDVTNVLKRIAK